MPSTLNAQTRLTAPSTRMVFRGHLDLVNRRLKAFDPCPGGSPGLDAVRRSYPQVEKVILYARPGHEQAWKARGYVCEGVIRGYFADRQDCWLWCGYLEPGRGRPRDPQSLKRNLELAKAPGLQSRRPLPEGYRSLDVTTAQVAEVVALMKSVFPVYPSELSLEALSRVVNEQTSCFRMVRNAEGQCVAVASAELNKMQLNAEMTDCATRPDQRGRGLMVHLLSELEVHLARHYRIFDLYSLARGPEPGINRVFARLGYQHTGSLINNCRMPTGWETMNLWCKFTASC